MGLWLVWFDLKSGVMELRGNNSNTYDSIVNTTIVLRLIIGWHSLDRDN